MALGIFTDPRMLNHHVPPGHPERPERLRAVLDRLEQMALDKTCPSRPVREAARDELALVHETRYLDRVEAADASRDGRRFDPDTWFFPGTGLAARLASGAAIDAVSFVMEAPGRRAFCAVRPPGHHARPAAAMGFCFYGNVAIAAETALRRFELDRVLIVDFDVHHGNGTQEIFYSAERVGFLSAHRYPFYPGTGARGETGAGAGLGATRNVPLPHGTPRAEYRAAFRDALESLADRIRPDLVLVSAGFDAHAADPVGDLGLEVEDFDVLTRDIVAVAEAHARGRIVSVLEGGYNVPVLADCVEAHLRALGVVAGTEKAGRPVAADHQSRMTDEK